MTATANKPNPFRDALKALAPRDTARMLPWCQANVKTPEDRPYDHEAYPHLGAPGGPCDAFDDDDVLEIALQFASRLGKTFFGQCAQMYTAATRPCPMMFASADEKLAKEVIKRTYLLLAKCKPLRDQLREANRRKATLVELEFCRMFVAWARSVVTLADKAVRVGHANEIDKWAHQKTSKEADPLKLFDDRHKEFPSHKYSVPKGTRHTVSRN